MSLVHRLHFIDPHNVTDIKSVEWTLYVSKCWASRRVGKFLPACFGAVLTRNQAPSADGPQQYQDPESDEVGIVGIRIMKIQQRKENGLHDHFSPKEEVESHGPMDEVVGPSAVVSDGAEGDHVPDT